MNVTEALELYRKLEFSIIPITYPKGGYDDGKRPALPAWEEFMKSPASIEQQDEWWKAGKTLNIGVITGEVSNIAVLDLDDTASYMNLALTYPKLADTLVAKTGKGFHVYFRPDRFEATRIFNLNGKTHHFKSNGGYVVAPPSRHQSGRTYEFVNLTEPLHFGIDDIADLIVDVGGSFPSTVSKDRPRNWAHELCEPVSSGSRNTIAAQLCGLLIRRFSYDPGLVMGLMKAWNSYYCDPPLEPNELQQLVDGETRRYGPHG